MSDLERRAIFEDFADDFAEAARAIELVDPDAELGWGMLRARNPWGEAGPPDPADFDWSSVRGTPVEE